MDEILNGIFKFLGIVGIVGILLLFSFLISQNKRHRKFMEHLKDGDPVKFYIGEEKYYGTANNVGKIFVDVTYFCLDTNCNMSMRKQRDELYPRFFYNYKK